MAFVPATENVTVEVAGHSLGQNQQEQMWLRVFSCSLDIHILRKSGTVQNRQSVLVFASSRSVSLVISRGKTHMSVRSGRLSPCLFVFWICCEQDSVTQQHELRHLVLQGPSPAAEPPEGALGKGLAMGVLRGKRSRSVALFL